MNNPFKFGTIVDGEYFTDRVAAVSYTHLIKCATNLFYPIKRSNVFYTVHAPFLTKEITLWLACLLYTSQTTLSKYVKAMRKQYNLTQVELSEKSGVGLRFVRELEQGKQTLRLDKVNQLLSLFGSEVGAVPITKTDE